jgi:hypothetical protein
MKKWSYKRGACEICLDKKVRLPWEGLIRGGQLSSCGLCELRNSISKS